MTEEARKSLAAGKLDEAQTYVNAARQMGSAGAALAAVERSARATRTRAATAAAQPPRARRRRRAANVDPLVADIRQRLSEGKLIDPPGDSATRLAGQPA